MKIPDKVKGHNKIRDAKIIHLYAEGKTMDEIGSRFDLTGSRIQQIIYRNRELLDFDKKYEKAKRINWLKRQLDKAGDSNKDSADILEQYRKEIEGDSDKQMGGINKVVVVYPQSPTEEKNVVKSDRIELNLPT